MLRNIENQSGSMALGSKRTADLMLRQFTGMPLMSPSTETVSSDTQSDTENYAAKKPKLEDDQFSADKINPSKVVHVRNLPQDTSETDIMALAAPFGKVTNMILMRNKRQAFVEMGDLIQAMNFVRQHQNPVNPAFVRSQTVQVQYSATYSELKPGQRSHANGMKPTPVLHINVDNLVMSVPLATLHSIFSQFGVVEKIITFNKNNQFQALIQMNDVDSAQLAKMVLDGKSIYPNCCVLRIDFSKMLSVNVKYNNEKSRDYTNPNLPSGDDTLPGANSSALNNSSMQAAATGMSPHIQPIVNSTQLQALGLVPSYVPFKQGAMVNPLNPLATLYNMNNYRMLGAMNPLQAPGIHSLAAHAYPQALQPSLTTQSSSRLPFASSPAAVAIQSMAANQLQALSHFPPSAQTPTSTSATTLQSLPETSMSSQLPLAQVATAAQLGHPYTPQLLAAYSPFHAFQQHQMLNLSHQLLPVSATPSSSISATQLGSSGHCTSPDVSTMSTPSPIIFGPATGSVVLVSNLNSKGCMGML